jgi:hypothetical protein
MPQRPTIGEILMNSGRISREDVARALEYQREHGGFFGEAMVACGFLSEGEVEWGLASQYDLPYVFPEAESVAYEAASLVTPDWALAHLTLPIMRTEESLQVIVDSPLQTTPVEELRARTGLRVDIALASPTRIRELIREVYARGSAADERGSSAPVELPRALDKALEVSAPRFGVSVRGSRAWAWWDDAGTIRRRPLTEEWLAELERALHPHPARPMDGARRAEWNGELSRAGSVTPVHVRFLSDETGSEYVFEPLDVDAPGEPPFDPPPLGIVSELLLLARTGRARFVVTAEPSELGRRLLPHLPQMLFDPGWRSIYIHADDRPAEAETFSRRLPEDADARSAELEALRAFRFDVVAADLNGGGAEWAAAALDVGSVAFVLWSGGDLGPARSISS